jgi:hypothetical protein
MRCRFLKPVKVLNPVFSERDKHRAEERGEKYDTPQWIEMSTGYEVNDPQAWIHCCPGEGNSAPIAEAVDDECKDAVRVWMEEKRPAAIAQIKAQIEQIDMIKHPKDRERLLALGRAYGLIGTGKSKPSSPPVQNPQPSGN